MHIRGGGGSVYCCREYVFGVFSQRFPSPVGGMLFSESGGGDISKNIQIFRPLPEFQHESDLLLFFLGNLMCCYET